MIFIAACKSGMRALMGRVGIRPADHQRALTRTKPKKQNPGHAGVLVRKAYRTITCQPYLHFKMFGRLQRRADDASFIFQCGRHQLETQILHFGDKFIGLFTDPATNDHQIRREQ